jgi:hypothetical protein
MELRKWLRQQSKDFYSAGFDELVNRLYKCINVGGGYVEKLIFFQDSNITCFTFDIHLWPIYLLSLVYLGCFDSWWNRFGSSF